MVTKSTGNEYKAFGLIGLLVVGMVWIFSVVPILTAHNWPVTSGYVIDAATPSRYKSGSLTIDYSVNGQPYSNPQPVWPFLFITEGSKVDVRYNPSNPQDIRVGSTAQQLLPAFFVTILLVGVYAGLKLFPTNKMQKPFWRK